LDIRELLLLQKALKEGRLQEATIIIKRVIEEKEERLDNP